MTCLQTFRIGFPNHSTGLYVFCCKDNNSTISLKLDESFPPIDEYQLSIENQEDNILRELGGNHPTISVYVEIVGSRSRIAPSWIVRMNSNTPERPIPLRPYRIGSDNNVCAIVYRESVRLILPIRSRGGDQIAPNRFKFTALESQKTSDGKTIEVVTFVSSGYMTGCPRDYRHDQPLREVSTYAVLELDCGKNPCTVDFSLGSPNSSDVIHVVYHQKPGSSIPEREPDSSNLFDFPTFKMLSWRNGLQFDKTSQFFLPLMYADPVPVRWTCVYKDVIKLIESKVLLKGANRRGTHLVSKTVRSVDINPVGTHILTSRVTEQSYLDWCRSRWTLESA
ncbi:hypothetical protein RF11_10404 [Thelohanellus kitauei]|uniref:Uncharacterized protein n=1 Tax=Thelohanellus kitauei TaxID=669202 RepID=A0A0C2MSX7_THEKT|nr:hypothetical protein RF11_10404 [Thelohanellus kitauei]